MMNKIKILIVDDHQIIRDGIISALSLEEDIQVVGEASSSDEALHFLERDSNVDVIVMDINLGSGENGIQLTKKIIQKYKAINILATSMYDDGSHILNMVKAGAIGYVLKGQGMKEFVEAIKTVATGDNYFSKPVSEIMLKQITRKSNGTSSQKKSDIIHLTKRETEILKLIAEEFTNQEIAEKLFISQRTVDSHRGALIQKLNVKNTAGLVKYAINHGYIEIY
jgi:DNA-binding NarL/FixJ family response regulator